MVTTVYYPSRGLEGADVLLLVCILSNGRVQKYRRQLIEPKRIIEVGELEQDTSVCNEEPLYIDS